MPRRSKTPIKPKRGGKAIAPGSVGVIYSRYSSHSQKDVSIEQQEKWAFSYAEEWNIPIVDTYADHHISGKTDKRKDFQRMMRDAAKGKFQYVISWKSNRIGRNMLEAMMNEARLNELGVRILYLEEDFDDSAAGRFAARSMMNVNQFYSENMAEDVVRGMIHNAENCLVNGPLILGYKKSEDGRYALDEAKASVVLEAFERVVALEPFVDIYGDLNRRGIKTASGKPWGPTSFNRMITNERYRGVYIWGDIRIDGGIPRIVSDSLFYKAQEVVSMKKPVKGRHRLDGDYMLTGKLFCGHCNSPMTGISGTSKTGSKHYYYTCRKRQTTKDCDKKSIRRDKTELAVATAIRQYILRDEVIEWIADSTIAYHKEQEANCQVSILEDELAETKTSIKNLMKAIEAGIITDTTKQRLLELEAAQVQLAAKIEFEKRNVVSVSREHLIAWIETFREGNVNDKEYQAKLFDNFLVSVHVYDSDLKITFSFTGGRSVTVPLDPSIVEDIENNSDIDSSCKLTFGVPNKYNPNQIFRIGKGFGLFVYFTPYEHTYHRNGLPIKRKAK